MPKGECCLSSYVLFIINYTFKNLYLQKAPYDTVAFNPVTKYHRWWALFDTKIRPCLYWTDFKKASGTF